MGRQEDIRLYFVQQGRRRTRSLRRKHSYKQKLITEFFESVGQRTVKVKLPFGGRQLELWPFVKEKSPSV